MTRIKKSETQKPSISKVNRQITIGFVLVTIALVVIIAYFSLSKAIVYLTPELTEVKNVSEVQILPDVISTLTSSNILPGIVTSTEVSLTQTFTPTVTELKDEKASGRVKIINNYSRSQTLVATTRLLAPNNNLYRLTETVIVPAGSSLFTLAVADQPGDAYQTSSSTLFTIPGLWEGIRDYIYAEATEPIKRQISISNKIKPQDLENARTTLLQKTEDEAKKQISNSSEYYIISDSQLISANSSQTAGESVATFDFTVNAKISIIAFKKTDLEKISVNNLKASLKDTQTYVSHNPDSLTYSLKTYDQKNSSATITVTIIGLASTDLENNFSKKDILGFAKEDVIKYFKSKPGVKQVEVHFSPAWVKSVPPLEDHVEINIIK